MNTQKNLLIVVALFISLSIYAQGNEMIIRINKLGAPVQSTMYGIFFEDINFGADGGLYAELVKNRSFEFSNPLQGWSVGGKFEIRNDGPFDKNPHYVRLFSSGHKHKYTVLENEGFFGIGIKKDAEYRFSVWARIPDGGSKGELTVELIDRASMSESQVYVSAELVVDSKEWKKYQVVLKSNVTDPKAVLRLFLNNDITIDVEHISLFPVDTWRGHENGMRKDLAQALYDLQPGLFRFPGGCIVEGADLKSRYQWKNSIGPVENRPINSNRWEYTFKHRYYSDYYQSYGLGFYEYFQLCEELGAEALPVLSCGLACQFQNTHLSAHQPVDQLDEYVQDALDLIEFANGDSTTEWGKKRVEMGHPAPFNLRYIAIGNEQWDSIYIEHLQPFVTAIRKNYPDIKIIGTSGPDSEGKQFDYLWPEMKKIDVDLVDEHFYRPESWFLSQGARYDNYNREGPKVFAGEYACHGKGKKWNHFEASLLEAAFMTGLERNADIVHMATYAPLFAHIEGWQWRPDLIWFDNLRSVCSCSYYVQQLYSMYKGTNVLKLTMDNKAVTGADEQNGLFASAVYDAGNRQIYVKVVNTSEREQPIKLAFTGLKRNQQMKGIKVITFHSDDLDADNTLDNPKMIIPREAKLNVTGTNVDTIVPPKTFALYILQR